MHNTQIGFNSTFSTKNINSNTLIFSNKNTFYNNNSSGFASTNYFNSTQLNFDKYPQSNFMTKYGNFKKNV